MWLSEARNDENSVFQEGPMCVLCLALNQQVFAGIYKHSYISRRGNFCGNFLDHGVRLNVGTLTWSKENLRVQTLTYALEPSHYPSLNPPVLRSTMIKSAESKNSFGRNWTSPKLPPKIHQKLSNSALRIMNSQVLSQQVLRKPQF